MDKIGLIKLKKYTYDEVTDMLLDMGIKDERFSQHIAEQIVQKKLDIWGKKMKEARA